MPLPTLNIPTFPNVPAAPGVPVLLRQASGIVNTAVTLAADARLIANAFGPPRWGLFDSNGLAVIEADSVVGVDYRREYHVADFPIEAGSFASYNKVATPYEIRVTLAFTGQPSFLSSLTSGLSLLTGSTAQIDKRHAQLVALEAAAASLNLISVVTPEFTYTNCSIIHHDYRRTQKEGATLIKVDVWLVQVRVAPAGTFTATRSVNGADPVSNGPSQPQAFGLAGHA